MPEALVGTGMLVRLALRRDRWLLPLWVVAFAAMAGSAASAGAGLFPDVASRIEAATALNASAAIVAMFGRVYDPSSLGALSVLKYTAFMTAILAVLMVVLTVRHTRAEEETGRLEILSGGRVGRDAPLAAALVVSVGTSLVLGLLSAAALAAGGLPGAGSLAFGLGWAATGMAFSAVAGVTAQVSATSRSATGAAVAVVAVTYGLRAVGDLAEPGPSALSWLSPIGWNQQVRAFAGDRWWVLLLPLALFAALVPLSFALRAARDLGGGLRAERPGAADGRIGGTLALAVRLQGRLFVAWAVGFVVFGALIGSLVSTVADFLSSSVAQDLIKQIGGEQALTDAFLAAEISVMGVVAAGFALSATGHLRSEEAAGHLETLLAMGATRLRWAASHAVVAVVGATLLLAATGLSIGLGAAISLGDPAQVGRVMVASLAEAPAAWVLAGAVLVVFGWAPRLAAGVWGLYVAFIALGEFGVLWHAPAWLMDVSPFRHSPLLPVGADGLPALLVLAGVAAALAGLGWLGWRRRDLAA